MNIPGFGKKEIKLKIKNMRLMYNFSILIQNQIAYTINF